MPFDHFNLIAGIYNRAGQFTVTEQLNQLLALSSNSSLLDAGGGTGRVSAALRSKVNKVVVADLSIGMLRHAKEKSLATVCTPAENLPFPSDIFDRVIMVDALHHVFSQSLTMQELWRILIPGGRILIIEPDIHQFLIKLLALGEKMVLMRSHFLSYEKIAAFFRSQYAQVKVVNNERDAIVLAEKVR